MVKVFYYDAFQKTLRPEPEGGLLVRHSDYAALKAQLAVAMSGLNTLATSFYKDDQHQDYAKHVLSALEATPPAPKVTESPCPDCGRAKATSANDAAKGYCPKHWAIMDGDADRDCERHRATLTAAQESGV